MLSGRLPKNIEFLLPQKKNGKVANIQDISYEYTGCCKNLVKNFNAPQRKMVQCACVSNFMMLCFMMLCVKFDTRKCTMRPID